MYNKRLDFCHAYAPDETLPNCNNPGCTVRDSDGEMSTASHSSHLIYPARRDSGSPPNSATV